MRNNGNEIALYRVPKAGPDAGAVEPVIVGRPVRGAAVDATRVFHTAALAFGATLPDTVYVAPKGPVDAGADADLGAAVSPSEGDPEDLVIDRGDVFWVNRSTSTIKVALGGAAPTVFAGNLDRPYSLAVDAAGVYWTEREGGLVRTCPRSGCSGPPRTLASLQAAPSGIAVDAVSVYWTNNVGGSIARVAK
jgi:hypothetical protein